MYAHEYETHVVFYMSKFMFDVQACNDALDIVPQF